MSRTTHSQIRGMFSHVKHEAVAAGVPNAETWELDHASCYGGWCIETRGGSAALGGHAMSSNRLPAGAFYQSLRTLYDVLESLNQS